MFVVVEDLFAKQLPLLSIELKWRLKSSSSLTLGAEPQPSTPLPRPWEPSSPHGTATVRE